MPISDVRHRGVDFDLVSVAGESPAEAPARSCTCSAFLVAPELFWWGSLEWSPKRQLLAVFTYFLVSKVAEIFMRPSWQPGSSVPVGFMACIPLHLVLQCKTQSSGAKAAWCCEGTKEAWEGAMRWHFTSTAVGKSRLPFLEWQPGLHSSGLLLLLVLRPATWSWKLWTVWQDLPSVVDGFSLHVTVSPLRTLSCFLCPLTKLSTSPPSVWDL